MEYSVYNEQKIVIENLGNQQAACHVLTFQIFPTFHCGGENFLSLTQT